MARTSDQRSIGLAGSGQQAGDSAPGSSGSGSDTIGPLPMAARLRRGLESLDPLGRPGWRPRRSGNGARAPSRWKVSRNQVRPFQMSRIVLPVTPYRFATTSALKPRPRARA